MKELSLHLLDLVQNSIEAGAKNIYIEMKKDLENKKLFLKVKDDGKGIPPEVLEELKDPFFTTRKTRKVGLGIPLFWEVVRSCNGNLNIKSEVGRGTEIIAEVPYDCIDLPPLGDISGTVLSLIVTNPDLNLSFKFEKNGDIFEFSTEDLKRELNGIPLNSLEVISFLKKYIYENLGGW